MGANCSTNTFECKTGYGYNATLNGCDACALSNSFKSNAGNGPCTVCPIGADCSSGTGVVYPQTTTTTQTAVTPVSTALTTGRSSMESYGSLKSFTSSETTSPANVQSSSGFPPTHTSIIIQTKTPSPPTESLGFLRLLISNPFYLGLFISGLLIILLCIVGTVLYLRRRKQNHYKTSTTTTSSSSSAMISNVITSQFSQGPSTRYSTTRYSAASHHTSRTRGTTSTRRSSISANLVRRPSEPSPT